jgi:hypothetical protein
LTFHCFFSSFRLTKRDLERLPYPQSASSYILKGARNCCLGDLLYFFEGEDGYGYLGSRYIKRTLLDIHCFGIMRRTLLGFLFHVEDLEWVKWYVFAKDKAALTYAKEYEFPSSIQWIEV